MVKLSKVALGALVAVCITSCGQTVVNDGHIGSYAMRLLEDTTSVEYGIIARSVKADVYGSIVLAGEPILSLQLGNYLMSCDNFNNIDGKTNPDGLPDFSGELICPLLDMFNDQYYKLVDSTCDKISEVTIKNFVSALDNTCHLNAFDTEKAQKKTPAKLVVLSSLYSSAYAYDDIDTLRVLSSSKVNVVSPIHSVLSDALAGRNTSCNIGLWVNNPDDIKLYETVLASLDKHRAGLNDSITLIDEVKLLDTRESFLSFLGRYIQEPSAKPLDVIVIDNYFVDLKELESCISDIMSVEEDEYITFHGILGKNLKVVELRQSVAAACFRHLRGNNAFTHNIEFPKSKIYTTYASEVDSTYITLELKDKYISSQMKYYLEVHTPNLYSDYVR